MSISDDDFGLGDDDTDFLAVATQVEASQHDFVASDRPTKRRRVSQDYPPGLDGFDSPGPSWSEAHQDAPDPPEPQSAFFANTPDPTAPNQAPADGEDEEDMEGHHFPGELEPVEDAQKTSRFKIHIPAVGGKFPDMIFTQTQHGLDEDPAAFRGAIWKRPPLQPPPAIPSIVNGLGNSTQVGKAGPGVVRNGINTYFQAVSRRTFREVDDKALAACLQAEENAQVRQRSGDAHSNGTNSSLGLAQDLEDLPDGAFSSSSPEKSPNKQTVIELSSQVSQAPTRPTALRGPQTGLRQMDLFGMATQDISASQVASKRHAWPLMARDEHPTHHKLDDKAMTTWVYPTNLGSIRDYQYNIVSRSLFHNTLVALPTGLGKTFIAATVMLNYYRWTTNSQIVFMAPTKPLIAQQMEACYGIVGIPKRDTVLMTGETAPAVRADEWLERRVFFMTPQTVINDLKTGICDPKKVVLLVVDEAHKATGGYAYTEVIAFVRRFNSSFRVLALTATPGSTTEAVQAVIDNLGIARVELRTESSLDIRGYTHEKHTETQEFKFSDEQELVMDLFAKVLKPALAKLNSQNAYWPRDPMALTAYGLTQARSQWMSSEAGRKAPQAVKGMVNAIFTVLSSLAHSIGLLKNHGIGPFYSCVLDFQKQVEGGQQKGKTASNIAHDEHFIKMMSTIRTWTNNPDFIGHPKLDYLREVVLNHFLDAGDGQHGSDVPPSATRIMIFASYRDSTEEICRVLKRNEPMIRPSVFVGQAASKGQEGMNQKRQNEVIQNFKTGKFNTLIATSIGEEGLDIGTVDLIICYDASSSPIRMLQRIGRTGRKRVGRVCLLLMEGKEVADYAKAQDNYAYIQKTIADPSKYSYRDDQSPRILPKEVRPVVDKRAVEIPPENSQPVDLNEKNKRGKGRAKTKRPPKKFHMPDNVRTGFVKASKLNSDSEADMSDDEAGRKRKKTALAGVKRVPAVFKTLSFNPEPKACTVPSLENVLLTAVQEQDRVQRYAQTADDKAVIHEPDACRFPEKLRSLGPTKHVQHGKSAQIVEKAMTAVHEMTVDKCHGFDEILHLSDLEDPGSASRRLVDLSMSFRAPGKAPITMSTTPNPREPSKKLPTPPVQQVESDSETDGRSVQPLGKKPRLRPKKTDSAPPPPERDSEWELELELPSIIVQPESRLTTTRTERSRPRKRQALQRASSYGSAAGEGVSSSPQPTPDDMRIGTQGIDLGSEDTSGEEDEEEADSEDMAFLQNTSDVVCHSSSQPGTQAVIHASMGIGRRRLKKTANAMVRSDSDGDDNDEEDEKENEDPSVDGATGVVEHQQPQGRKRKVVVEESDDE